MIKVKEMKKLMERVEEFGEYELLFDRFILYSPEFPQEQELEIIKLDHQGNSLLIGLKK